MKAQLLKITHKPISSFSVRQDIEPNINNKWHYHQELELIYFHKGYGTQFIGDHIKNFNAGDVLLLGSKLPHYWMFEGYNKSDIDEKPYSTVIHFLDNFLGESFLNIPESRMIKSLFEKAGRGILISGKQAKNIIPLINKVHQSKDLYRITALIECLSTISELKDLQLLSSLGFRYNDSDTENNRLNIIYNYTLKNFKTQVYLSEIASVAGLTPNSFCRYFKNTTGKTYNQFLLEIRIGYACKLILDNILSIKQVCFESGFQNFSCFHKNFKNITGYTPQMYREIRK